MEGIDEVDEDVDVDVDSYVSNLRRQTEDTVDLVQKLHSTTGKLKQVHRRISAEYVAPFHYYKGSALLPRSTDMLRVVEQKRLSFFVCLPSRLSGRL